MHSQSLSNHPTSSPALAGLSGWPTHIQPLSPRQEEEYGAALNFLLNLHTPGSLTTVQTAIFYHCWLGLTYQEIAEELGYDASYIRKNGSQLWRFLSEQLGEEVKKSNFKVIIQRQLIQPTASPFNSPGTAPSTRMLSPINPSAKLVSIATQSTTHSIATVHSNTASTRSADGVSDYYQERPPIEHRCCETLMKEGSLIRIKAAAQMGKTALMNQILQYAHQQQFQTVTLSFRLASDSVLSSVDRFFRWFCATVGHQLDCPNQVESEWDDIFGESYNCTHYFETHLLQRDASAMVLALDDVDRLFQYPAVATNFFQLLRAWHEKAKHGGGSGEVWKKLRLIIVHSTEVYLPLHHHQSPFNIGLSIKLPEFTELQVQQLGQAYGLELPLHQVHQWVNLVGGHPGLVELTLEWLQQENASLEQVLSNVMEPEGLYYDYLQRQLRSLQQYPDLMPLVQEIMTADAPVTVEILQAFRLESLGLVKLQGHRAVPNSELYRQYFRKVLG